MAIDGFNLIHTCANVVSLSDKTQTNPNKPTIFSLWGTNSHTYMRTSMLYCSSPILCNMKQNDKTVSPVIGMSAWSLSFWEETELDQCSAVGLFAVLRLQLFHTKLHQSNIKNSVCTGDTQKRQRWQWIPFVLLIKASWHVEDQFASPTQMVPYQVQNLLQI